MIADMDIANAVLLFPTRSIQYSHHQHETNPGLYVPLTEGFEVLIKSTGITDFDEEDMPQFDLELEENQDLLMSSRPHVAFLTYLGKKVIACETMAKGRAARTIHEALESLLTTTERALAARINIDIHGKTAHGRWVKHGDGAGYVWQEVAAI